MFDDGIAIDVLNLTVRSIVEDSLSANNINFNSRDVPFVLDNIQNMSVIICSVSVDHRRS